MCNTTGQRGAGQYGSSQGYGNVAYGATASPANPGGVVGGAMNYGTNRANLMPSFNSGPAGQFGMSGSTPDYLAAWGGLPPPPVMPPGLGPGVPRTGGFQPPVIGPYTGYTGQRFGTAGGAPRGDPAFMPDANPGMAEGFQQPGMPTYNAPQTGGLTPMEARPSYQDGTNDLDAMMGRLGGMRGGPNGLPQTGDMNPGMGGQLDAFNALMQPGGAQSMQLGGGGNPMTLGGMNRGFNKPLMTGQSPPVMNPALANTRFVSGFNMFPGFDPAQAMAARRNTR